MSSSDPLLFDLVRQLRAELEWAARSGLVDSSREARPAQRPRSEVSGLDASRAITPSMAVEAVRSHAATGALPVLQVQLDRASDLTAVRSVLGDCDRCKLAGLGRKNIVFGVGNAQAEVMFVGEGPGADEDQQGEPFVGRAGQLLTRIIEQGMKIARSEVYIANIVKCRPPQNRDPETDEVASCEPFLKAQIRLVAPKVVIALGRHAAQTLLQTRTPVSRLRGKWAEYAGIPLMPTYHPAYLLRNPAEKRPVWEDIQEVMRFLEAGQG